MNLVTVGLLVVGAGACSSPSENSSAPTSSTTVPIASDANTTVQVDDRWTVEVPAGAAPDVSSLTVVTDLPDLSAIPNEIARAEISLSSGQPQRPLKFTYRLPEPAPIGTTAYLLDRSTTAIDLADLDNPPPEATVIEAQLNADRTVATATVPHLSPVQWFLDRIDDADHFVSSLAGQRGAPPACDTQPRPAWMDNVIYLDEQNAPLRVCTGTDPADHDVAVVKIRNNRGGAMTVTAPVTPQWAAVNVWDGQIGSVIADMLTVTAGYLGVPADARSRTWVLPPGGGVDIGFTQSSLESTHGTATIKTTFSLASAAYGMIWSAISDAVSDHTTLTAIEMGFMAVCVDDAARATSNASDTTQLAASLGKILTCAVEKLPDVLSSIKANVPAKVWTSLLDKGLYRAANTIVTKLTPLLAIGKTTIVIGDLLGTLSLPDSAFTLTMFTAIKKPTSNSWTATDHSYGQVTLGMTADQAAQVLGANVMRAHYYSCTVLSNGTGTGYYTLQLWISDKTQTVTGIDTPAGTRTDRNVGDGSTRADIKTAYNDYTIEEGNIGGQGTPAVAVHTKNTSDRSHYISFPIKDNGTAGPPSIGRPYAAEGC